MRNGLQALLRLLTRTSGRVILAAFALSTITCITIGARNCTTGKAVQQMRFDLKSRNYERLCEPTMRMFKTAFSLGDAGLYCVGLHLQKAGHTQAARQFFEFGAEHSPEPFKTLCSDEGRSNKKLDIPSHENAQKVFFLSEPFSLDLYALMNSAPQSTDGVSRFENQMYVRLKVFMKEYEAAWNKAEVLLQENIDVLLPAAWYADCGKAALYGSPHFSKNADFFASLYETTQAKEYAPDALLHVFSFYAGRLYSKAGTGFYPRAQQFLLAAQNLANTDKNFDAALWYRLSLLREQSFDNFFTEFMLSIDKWKNPAWYTDLIDFSLVKLVQKKRWNDVYRLFRALPDTEHITAYKIRAAYIAARSGFLPKSTSDELLTLILNSSHNEVYYRILASYFLDQTLEPAKLFPQFLQLDIQPRFSPSESKVVLQSLIDFSLQDLLVSFMQSGKFVLSPDDSVLFANAVKNGAIPAEGGIPAEAAIPAEGAIPAESVRFMAAALKTGGMPANIEQCKVLYPLAFSQEIQRASKEFSLPAYILFALARAESLFQPHVVSRAGAIGLTQIMPSTGKDIARQLKTDTYDLKDAALNARFGAYFLTDLIKRNNSNVLHACIAYNAGPGRLRSWKRSYTGLSDDLFLEGLPFSETRGYGKKLFLGSVYYGLIYHEKTLVEIISLFFPTMF